ncbi:UNVERIFIED_CONTAM: hypothetical protein HDU68_005829 [Siphonaria sp. JEL0065]|nr:hypothetical protein HDU68_005829 [Siphonaria sp. JEL0065]
MFGAPANTNATLRTVLVASAAVVGAVVVARAIAALSLPPQKPASPKLKRKRRSTATATSTTASTESLTASAPQPAVQPAAPAPVAISKATNPATPPPPSHMYEQKPLIISNAEFPAIVGQMYSVKPFYVSVANNKESSAHESVIVPASVEKSEGMYAAKPIYTESFDFPDVSGNMYRVKPYYSSNASSPSLNIVAPKPASTPLIASQKPSSPPKAKSSAEPVLFGLDPYDLPRLEKRAVVNSVSGPRGQSTISYRTDTTPAVVCSVEAGLKSSAKSPGSTKSVKSKSPIVSSASIVSQPAPQVPYGLDFHEVQHAQSQISAFAFTGPAGQKTITYGEYSQLRHNQVLNCFIMKIEPPAKPVVTQPPSTMQMVRSVSPVRSAITSQPKPVVPMSSPIAKPSIAYGLDPHEAASSTTSLYYSQLPTVTAAYPFEMTYSNPEPVFVAIEKPAPESKEIASPTTTATIGKAVQGLKIDSSSVVRDSQTPMNTAVGTAPPTALESVIVAGEPARGRSRSPVSKKQQPNTQKQPSVSPVTPKHQQPKVEKSKSPAPVAVSKSASKSPVPKTQEPIRAKSTATTSNSTAPVTAPKFVREKSPAVIQSPSRAKSPTVAKSPSRAKSPATSLTSPKMKASQLAENGETLPSPQPNKSQKAAAVKSEFQLAAKEFVPSFDATAASNNSTSLRVTAQEFVPLSAGSSPTTDSTSSLRPTAQEFSPDNGFATDPSTQQYISGYASPPFLGGDPMEAYNPYAAPAAYPVISAANGPLAGGAISPAMVDMNGVPIDQVWDPSISAFVYADPAMYDVYAAGSVQQHLGLGVDGGVEAAGSRGGKNRNRTQSGNTGNKKGGSSKKKGGDVSKKEKGDVPSGPTLADFLKVDKKKGVVVVEKKTSQNSLVAASASSGSGVVGGDKTAVVKCAAGVDCVNKENGACALYHPTEADPRAQIQRPIKSGIFGAGIDHVSFLEFEDAEIIFRRRLGLPVKEKKNEKEAEKVRLTSTHRQDFTASGFIVDAESVRGKPAGRPTKPSDDCEPFCLLSTNQHKDGEVDGGRRQNGHVKQ